MDLVALIGRPSHSITELPKGHHVRYTSPAHCPPRWRPFPPASLNQSYLPVGSTKEYNLQPCPLWQPSSSVLLPTAPVLLRLQTAYTLTVAPQTASSVRTLPPSKKQLDAFVTHAIHVGDELNTATGAVISSITLRPLRAGGDCCA